MSKKDERPRPEARLPKGLFDISAGEIRATQEMLGTIRTVFESYGFEPLDTPAIEYTDALGKFLPDQDRPNEGVFSFKDDDEQWLSLRYDLTAPLARYVAENYQSLPKPLRRYQVGPVWRNEKPGPGRFRQFTQFDADTVGASSVAADAELCMLAADTLEALGIKRGQYVVKVNNRKVLEGVLEHVGVVPDRHTVVLRAIDKLDRLGLDGVRALLGKGRKDESGDFTKGAGLGEDKIRTVLMAVDAVTAALGVDPEAQSNVREAIRERLRELDSLDSGVRRNLLLHGKATKETEALLNDEQVWKIRSYLGTRYFDDSIDVQEHARAVGETAPVKYAWGRDSFPSDEMTFSAWRDAVGDSVVGSEGISELRGIAQVCRAAGYGPGRILFDSSVVRGLEYYTGPVFEAELTPPIKDERGQPIRLGSVVSGGRYDGLVERFTGEKVPATGVSIGVSRLLFGLQRLGKFKQGAAQGPVVILVFPDQPMENYQRLAQRLRHPDDGGDPIRAEVYLGSGKIGAQTKYADKRGAPCVVIQGETERNHPEGPKVTIKDLILGATLTETKDRDEYLKKQAEAQFSVPESDLVNAVRRVLARHKA